MPKTTKEPQELPVAEKLMWSDADMVALGIGSRTTLWRLRRDDPDFPKKVRGRTFAEEVREYHRSRRQAA